MQLLTQLDLISLNTKRVNTLNLKRIGRTFTVNSYQVRWQKVCRYTSISLYIVHCHTAIPVKTETVSTATDSETTMNSPCFCTHLYIIFEVPDETATWCKHIWQAESADS